MINESQETDLKNTQFSYWIYWFLYSKEKKNKLNSGTTEIMIVWSVFTNVNMQGLLLRLEI